MKNVVVYLRYKSFFISLPFSTKHEREMTKFYVVWEMRTTTAKFSYFHLELNVAIAYLA